MKKSGKYFMIVGVFLLLLSLNGYMESQSTIKPIIDRLDWAFYMGIAFIGTGYGARFLDAKNV